MTAQEKAIQLINKFTYFNTELSRKEAILSALNAVDEIINAVSKYDVLELTDIKYWQEVIEKIINYKEEQYDNNN